MNRSKFYRLTGRVTLLFMCLQLLIQCIPLPNENSVKAEGLDFGNAYVKPVAVGTKRYMVGFMSYEIWSNAAGVWTTKAPGESVSASELSYPYSFSFPGRTVKDVKVYSFNGNNEDHKRYFKESRSTDDYLSYSYYFSKTNGDPKIIEEPVKGTSKASFTVGLPVKLEGTYSDVIDENKRKIPPVLFADGVQARRYYYPVLFEVELNGQAEINYFSTDGTRVAPSTTFDMSIGTTYPDVPIEISGYTYSNKYKKTLDGSDPSGASMLTGKPNFTYDGSFDIYKLNYYFDLKSTNGTASVKHVDENGKTLSPYVFTDHNDILKKDQPYEPSHPENTKYEYLGYVKSTETAPVTDFSKPNKTSEYSITPKYLGGYDVQLYYVYRLIDQNKKSATAHIRHMVRADASSPFVKKGEETKTFADLPHNEPFSASESLYGTYLGRSVNGSAYIDTYPTGPLVPKTSSVTIPFKDPETLETYITYFYEAKAPKNFTGDFDVIKPSISYHDSFTLKPKNFVMNTCEYSAHQFMIVRDGRTYTTDKLVGQTTSITYTAATYPWLIGIGTHQVYMKIYTTNCGESDWIGPKTLDVSGPTNNHPPTFKGGFIAPGDTNKTVLTQVVQGTMVDLTVWDFADEDGDDVYWDGFDFGAGDTWIQSIPTSSNYPDFWFKYIKADQLGYHTVKAYAHDEYGATASITIVINVVPINPIPVITGPKKVVEGRPVTPELSSEGSYSYVGRTINHTRDEWTNKKSSYSTVGTETITLHVYDSIGLKSLEPAVYKLEVIPDLPPIPDLQYSSPTVRGSEVQFKDLSYSPDGDKIVEHTIKLRHDSNNDGDFSNETAVNVSFSSDGSFSRKFTVVGKYQFEVYVKEDWGRSGKKTFDFEVVNDGPTVTFEASTESQKPVVIPTVPVTASAMVNTTSWTNSNIDNEVLDKAWGANSSTGTLAHSPMEVLGYDFTLGSSNEEIYYSPRGFEGIDSSAQVVGESVSSFSSSNSCSEYYCSFQTSVPIYIKDGKFVTHYRNTYSGSYDVRVNIGIGSDGYPIYRKGSDPNDDVGEEIMFVDYKNSLVWTRIFYYDRPNNSTAYRYAKYKMDDFLSPSGMPMATYSVPMFQSNDFTTSTSTEYVRYEYLDANKTTTYTYYSWSDPLTKLRSVTVAGNTPIPGPKLNRTAKMEYLFNPRYTLGLFNINSMATTKVYDTNYGSASQVSPDGKYVLNGSSVFEVGKTDPIFSFYSPSYVTYSQKDKVITCEYITCSLYQWNWRTDGKFTPIKTNFSYGYSFLDDIYGNIYYMNNQGIFKIDYKTNEITVVKSYPYNFGSEYPSNNVSISYSAKMAVSADGLLRTQQTARTSTPSGSSTSYTVQVLKMPSPLIENKARLGEQQLLGKVQLTNAQYSYSLRLNDEYGSRSSYAGFSFHAQDNRNMYRVEANLGNVRLVRVDGGVRTVLAEKAYTILPKTLYNFKISILDNKIKVYVGGAPILEVTDSTFDRGSFGPYSQVQQSEFLNVMYSNLDVLSSKNKLNGIALVGQDITYTTTLDDTEKDPIVKDLTKWTYKQVSQKFLDAGDGKSGISMYNGKTYTEPVLVMDKVGQYDITYETEDDPNPSYLYPSTVFGTYRSASNLAARTLIVHRAPIADYDVTLNADKTVKWTDRSYDPDRYLSATNYSTENTGIDYKATRGVLEKMFYYITPSGETVNEKLVVAPETGKYTVGLAVKDEYNAWSTIVEKTIVVDALPSPNEPPVAGFTLSTKETYRNASVTINSTASDKEDGDRTHLPHAYYISNDASAGFETLQSTIRTSWTKSFSTLGVQKIRQTVEDSLGQTATFTDYVNIINRIPTANITVPASADQNNPTKFTEARPTFKWTYSDADGDAQSKYQLKIYRYGGILEYESGVKSAASTTWTIDTDLAEKTYFYVNARVFDGYDWGDWSAAKFFYIETNRPPIAQFDWTPKPVWEGDPLQLINQSSDPDGDLITSVWTIVLPSGIVRTFTETPSFAQAEPGTYKVTLVISDGKASASSSSNIVVLPLSIDADVRHTDEWKKVHDEEGHETSTNPKDFYAGEIMLASARTTSDAPVRKVVVKLTATGLDGGDLSREWQMSITSTADRYAAELFDTKWASLQEGLPKGLYKLKFIVIYANGTTKSVEVPVRIIGSVYSVVGVHRRQ